MTRREYILARMRAAGYHADTRTFTRLYIENRVRLPIAQAAFREGERARRAGMRCTCWECEKEKTS